MTGTTTPRKHSESRRLHTVAGVRVSNEEMAQLRATAAEHGQSVSNFLRTLVLPAIRTS